MSLSVRVNTREPKKEKDYLFRQFLYQIESRGLLIFWIK